MNSDNAPAVREETNVSLRDLFWYVLKQWKILLIIIAALALLLGGFQGIKTFGQYRKQESKTPSGTESSTQNADGAITAQPKSVSVSANSQVEFSIQTKGEVVKYQWQYSKDGMSWNSLNTSTYPSAATAKLSFRALSTQNNYLYRCSVTFADEEVITSEGAVLTVTATPSAGKVTKGDILKNTVKYMVLGAVLGLVLGVFWFAARFLIMGWFTNGDDLENRYGARCFGVYPSRKYTGINRRILDRLTGRPDVAQEESGRLIAADINMALPAEETVYVTGTVDDKRLRSICKVLQPHVKVTLKPLACVNVSADAVNALQEGLPVICVERVLVSRRAFTDPQMKTIARSDSECKGFVLIE